MKKLLLLMILIFSISVSTYAENTSETVQVQVNGLVCDFCARALEKVFSKEDAVDNINVDLDTKIITIQLKEGQNLENEKISNMVKDSGYDVKEINRDK